MRATIRNEKQQRGALANEQVAHMGEKYRGGVDDDEDKDEGEMKCHLFSGIDSALLSSYSS